MKGFKDIIIYCGLQVRHKDTLLQNAMEDINKMRKVTKNIIEAGDPKSSIPSCVAARPVSCDNDYFSSYSHFGIHYDMLSVRIIRLLFDIII